MSGNGLKSVAALGLGSLQNFRDHAVVDSSPLGDHALSGLSFSQHQDPRHRAGIRPKPLGLRDALGQAEQLWRGARRATAVL